MYLKRLVCRNLRVFDELDIDLCPLADMEKEFQNEQNRLLKVEQILPESPYATTNAANVTDHYPGWCVITGDNGTGKSTILKAIAVAMLGPDQARPLQSDYRGWVASESDSAQISLEIRPDTSIDRTKGGGAQYKNTFWAEVDIVREEGTGAGGQTWLAVTADHFRKKKKGASNGPWAQATGGWLSLGYGPFRRLYGSSPTAAGLEADPKKARFATLFMEDATLIEAERWLKELDYRSARGSDGSAAEAAETLSAVTSLLRADFLRNGMEFQRVDADGVWLRDSSGRELRLGDMSEGYRAALAMLIDIIRHMVLEYGSADLVEADPQSGEPYVALPAVVLIDEVDAHLHPTWQQEIGFWLKRHFPKIQFIVTTHSPLVCQAADGGRVYSLPPGERPRRLSPEEYLRVLSGGSDAVLQTSAFGLANPRSSRVQRALKRHARVQQLSLLSAEDEAALSKERQQLSMFLNGELEA